jgi:SAM-dependent methyltransferase
MSSFNPTQRFSDRVENYAKYRPTYPPSIIPYLRETIHLTRKNHIADIGSGTGIFTDLFLHNGFSVAGVEPNDAMRAAGEAFLGHYHAFNSVNGTAEAKNLPYQSVDLITMAQAFHWVEPVAARKEFTRILRPGGHILLVWNVRTTDTPFMEALDNFKASWGRNYKDIRERHAEPESIKSFFAPAPCTEKVFRHSQIMDYEALRGQVLSSSYMPLEGDPKYTPMIESLEALFQKYQEKGQIDMEFETKLFLDV